MGSLSKAFNAHAPGKPGMGRHDNGSVNLAEVAVRSGDMDMVKAVLGLKPSKAEPARADVSPAQTDIPKAPPKATPASTPPKPEAITLLKPPTIRKRGRGIGGQGGA